MESFDFNRRLYVVTESAISKGRGNEEVVREAIKGGAEIIQLREKQRGRERVKEEAVRLLKICRKNDILFILNDYVDIALEIGADGVHLGQSDMQIAEARKICGDKLIIGLSTHSVEQALKADKEDVDYMTIGPIFRTRAKDYTVGTEIIKKVVSAVKKPVIAIGGINMGNIDEVLRQGAESIAVISAVVAANNIEGEAKKLANKIKSF